jgi:protein-S-isoprenylcysteine O-methyltransferase Ste14
MTRTLLTAVLWTAFVAYWLFASRHAKRTVATGQPPLVRAAALVFIALGPMLYYLPLSSVPFLGWRLGSPGHALTTVGLGLMVLGLLFAVWARRRLADNWSGAVTLKEDHALVTTGPYSIVRHPIYLGVFVAMLGTGIVIGEVRAFLPLLGIFGIWGKMAAEETLLRAAFPRQYEEYAKRVKRLIPGIL